LVNVPSPSSTPSNATEPQRWETSPETIRAINKNAQVLKAISKASFVTPTVTNKKAGLKATRAVVARTQLCPVTPHREMERADHSVRAKA
jgi:hypothetical protein